MTELLIENEQDKIALTDELIHQIKRVCDRVLESEECNFDAQISITFADNAAIRRINREQRGIDRPTDVLSFPMLEFDEEGNAQGDYEYDYDTGLVILGDIVISMEKAVEQAENFGHSFLREVCFLTVHSMLHLLGYDHVDDPRGEAVMNEKQEKILQELGITRD